MNDVNFNSILDGSIIQGSHNNTMKVLEKFEKFNKIEKEKKEELDSNSQENYYPKDDELKSPNSFHEESPQEDYQLSPSFVFPKTDDPVPDLKNQNKSRNANSLPRFRTGIGTFSLRFRYKKENDSFRKEIKCLNNTYLKTPTTNQVRIKRIYNFS